ncbi:MAG: hypothetical protein WA183_11775 [Chthoniobacterales bacterium]
MAKFFCSYAYDVPCYADFYVEADSEEAAEKLIQEKLEAGAFSGVVGNPCWENAGENERVFVSSEADEDDDAGRSLGDLFAGSQNPSPP